MTEEADSPGLGVTLVLSTGCGPATFLYVLSFNIVIEIWRIPWILHRHLVPCHLEPSGFPCNGLPGCWVQNWFPGYSHSSPHLHQPLPTPAAPFHHQFNSELNSKSGYRRPSMKWMSNLAMPQCLKFLTHLIVYTSFLYSWLFKSQFSTGKNLSYVFKN